MTSDGSYYVWIPRYSYRIIYFNSQANEDAYRAGTLTEEEALVNTLTALCSHVEVSLTIIGTARVLSASSAWMVEMADTASVYVSQ